MKSWLQQAPPFVVPALFIVAIIVLTLVWGSGGKFMVTGNQLAPGDIYSSKLAPVAHDQDHLELTVKLTQSGLDKVKAFRDLAGVSTVSFAYQGTSLGPLPPENTTTPAMMLLILPKKEAIAARMAIGR